MEAAGAARLLATAAAILIVCVVLMRLANQATSRTSKAATEKASAKLADGPSGFRMILSNRYLFLIASLVVLLNVVNTSGEYLFGRYVVSAAETAYGAGPASEAARQRFIGQTYGSYYSYINLIGFLLQMFVVSRVIKWLGVGRSLFIHPIVALSSYLLMLRAPSLEAVRALKIADNSISYSLGNTAIQTLWLPTSRETKYKAKQAVDSFCMRAGDVLQAGIVYTGELTGLTVSGFAALNVVFGISWLAVVAALRDRLRAHAQQTGGAEL